MKLTATHLATIRDFLSSVEKENDFTIDYVELSNLLTKITGIEFKALFINNYDDKYIYIRGGINYILLYRLSGHNGHNETEENQKPKGFLWQASLSKGVNDGELTLNDVLNNNNVLIRINYYKDTIEEMVKAFLPVCEKFIEKRNLVSNAKWGFDRAEQFYENYVAVDSEEIDTDDCLKLLRKEKMEHWNAYICKSHDGKNATIDWYKRVFENIQDVYGRIVELNKPQVKKISIGGVDYSVFAEYRGMPVEIINCFGGANDRCRIKTFSDDLNVYTENLKLTELKEN